MRKHRFELFHLSHQNTVDFPSLCVLKVRFFFLKVEKKTKTLQTRVIGWIKKKKKSRKGSTAYFM